jgi:arylsulfatase A-like enzyme/Flp pilus assembly protein TadD
MDADFRRGLLGLGAAFLLGLSGCSSKSTPEALLLVTIDTCRADRFGCYGAKSGATASTDRLAERGAVFLDASAPTPLTLPSHCSILTGLYPDRHSVRDNGAGQLPEEAETLAEILQGRGWSTAAFVAAFPLDASFGANQGFDTYGDEFTGLTLGEMEGVPEHSEDVAKRLFYDERVASEVASEVLPWLSEARKTSRPFFAWVHFFDPHANYRPPPHWGARYGHESYEGEIAFADEQIGRILTELEPIRERLTVVITADHGESLGEHQELTHGLFLYQSSLSVPWVMAGPKIPKGVRVAEPVSLVQVLPTILESLGIPEPEGLDGESALGLADAASRGGSPPADESAESRAGGEGSGAELFGECLFPRIHYDWAALRYVRRADWKLIDAPRPELYDLASDPDETRNLVDARPDIAASLREALSRHESRGGKSLGFQVEVDESTRERLEALGYVGGTGAALERVREDPWNTEGRDPKDMVGFFNQLQEVPTLMLTGKNAQADSLLDLLRRGDPRNRSVLEKLALLRRFEEKWDEARSFCEEILAIDPGDARIRKNLAFTLLRLENYDRAQAEYERVIAAHPDDEEALGFLGSILSRTGRHAEAVAALERAAVLAPSDPNIAVTLARAWEDSGEEGKALQEYDRALALDPSLSEAVNGKALLLSHQARPREAVAVLRKALPALAEDVDVLNNLAWILTNESIDPEEGYAHAKRAAELAPEDPAILDTLGWSAVRSRRFAEAIAPLQKAFDSTGDSEVRAHLGVALAESGRSHEGMAHIRAARAEKPELARLPELQKWGPSGGP